MGKAWWVTPTSPGAAGADLSGYLRPTGAIAETFSRASTVGANYAALSTGRLSMVAIGLPAGATISSISFMSATTALSAGTNQLFGLFDSSRGRLATTANGTSGAWGSNSVKTMSFAAPFVTTYAGLYYLGCMVAASTVPTLMAGPAQQANVYALAPLLSGTSDTGLTTSLPATAAALTAVPNVPYAYVS